jgi:hypothetical protein
MTEQDSIELDKTILERDREIIFFIFENKMDIFVLIIIVLWTKSCHLV